MVTSAAARLGVLRATPRRVGVVLALGALTILLAACNRVDSGTLGFWDIIWSMVVLFFMVLYIFIFISIFMDVFRRDDLSGAWKAIWIICLIIFPFLTAIVYIFARPKVTAQDIQMAARADAAAKAAAGVSTADELAKLQALKNAGTISQTEFDSLKAKIVS